jgi:hypothetical protein
MMWKTNLSLLFTTPVNPWGATKISARALEARFSIPFGVPLHVPGHRKTFKMSKFVAASFLVGTETFV